MRKQNLKNNYKKAVMAYIHKFCEISELDFDGFVGGFVGEICQLGDYYFNFSDIMYLIDNSIKYDWLIDWYDYSLQFKDYKLKFSAYCSMRRTLEYNLGFGFRAELLHLELTKLRF